MRRNTVAFALAVFLVGSSACKQILGDDYEVSDGDDAGTGTGNGGATIISVGGAGNTATGAPTCATQLNGCITCITQNCGFSPAGHQVCTSCASLGLACCELAAEDSDALESSACVVACGDQCSAVLQTLNNQCAMSGAVGGT